MLDEEPPELGDDHRADPGMPAALALPQALLLGVVAHAVEALGPVEVEVVPAYPGLQPQEALDPLELGHRVVDQLVAVHHEDLTALEHLEPAVHVLVVEGYGDRPVGLVDRTVGPQGQLLEATLGARRRLGGDGDLVGAEGRGGRGRVAPELRVVRDRPGHGLPDYHQQAHARVHRVDALRDLLVAREGGRLLGVRLLSFGRAGARGFGGRIAAVRTSWWVERVERVRR